MKPGWIDSLLALYPSWFRGRYGAEYAALLEQTRPTAGTVIDILRGAAKAHLADGATQAHGLSAADIVILIAQRWSFLAASAAITLGGAAAVYGLLDDTPAAAAMRTGTPLGYAWEAFLISLALATAFGVAAIASLAASAAGRRASNGPPPPMRRSGLPWFATTSFALVLTAGAVVAAAPANHWIAVAPAGGRWLLAAAQALTILWAGSALRVLRRWLERHADAPGTTHADAVFEARDWAARSGQWASTAMAATAVLGTAIALASPSPLVLGPVHLAAATATALTLALLATGAGLGTTAARQIRGLEQALRAATPS